MFTQRVTYAYRKIRAWYVSPVKAGLLAVRYGITGDSGRFSTHGGWRVSRIRISDPAEEQAEEPSLQDVPEQAAAATATDTQPPR